MTSDTEIKIMKYLDLIRNLKFVLSPYAFQEYLKHTTIYDKLLEEIVKVFEKMLSDLKVRGINVPEEDKPILFALFVKKLIIPHILALVAKLSAVEKNLVIDNNTKSISEDALSRYLKFIIDGTAEMFNTPSLISSIDEIEEQKPKITWSYLKALPVDVFSSVEKMYDPAAGRIIYSVTISRQVTDRDSVETNTGKEEGNTKRLSYLG